MGYFRYFLAVLVLIPHVELELSHPFLNQGGTAVSVFFFISGFIIPLAFEMHYADSPVFSWLSTLKFYLNRFLRIYPIYWLAVLIAFLDYKYLNVINNPNEVITSGYSIFRNFILIGVGYNNSFGMFASQAWTLDVELQWYFLVPFIFLLRNSKCELILFALLLTAPTFFLNLIPSNLIPYRSIVGEFSLFFAGYMLFRFRFVAEKKYDSNDFRNILLLGSILFALSIFNASMSLAALIIIAIPLLLSQTSNSPSKLERLFGDLSYPVYILNQGITPIVRNYLRKYWLGFGFDDFGIYYYVYQISVNIIIISFISYLALLFIGYPIDKIRNKNKNKT